MRHHFQRLCLTVFLCGCTPEAPERASQPVQPAASEESLPEKAAPTRPEPEWARQKPEFLAIAEKLEKSNDPNLGMNQVVTMRNLLKRQGMSSERELELRYFLSQHLLRLGELDAAIKEIESVFTLVRSVASFGNQPNAPMHQVRAMIYLRQAETENCVKRHNADCCIFPLQKGGIHSETAPAEKAKQSLLAALQLVPEDLASRWLLNIVGMALSQYPDGIPAAHRIPPQAFQSAHDVGRFVDVAPALGLDAFNLCGGAIVEDFDSDGLLDVVTSTYDPRGPLTYHRNLGNRDSSKRFENLSSSSHLDDQLGGLNCIAADYDNDGDMDILVLRGAWLGDEGRIRNSLLRNNGDQTFTDVTRLAGLAEPAQPSQAGVWGDFDNDGDLDVYIGNESPKGLPNRRGNYPSQLFRNNGDGTFTDIAPAAGVTNDRFAKGVAAGDYDNDGDLDLYVSNNLKDNRLYKNNADGTFTDVAHELGLTKPDRSFATWFFDYDNDGWLDLFVTAYQTTIADVASHYLGQPHEGSLPCLYRNDGQGHFSNVANQKGLGNPYLPMGANFGDLDNDGYLDIYLATGDPDYRTLMPNIMLRNDRGERFQDVTTSGGFGHLQKGHGVAFADIDNDGDQDIYHQLGGFYPGDRFHNALFLNPGGGNHFLYVDLVGVDTNRRGLGARIKLIVSTEGGPREIHRAVGSVSSFGGSPMRQEIGIGNATAIESLEVRWPRSKTTQVFEGVPLNSMIRVTEHAGAFERVELERIELRRP